jgi:hypothetical protein
MSSYPGSSGDDYGDVPLGRILGKPIKSLHVDQDEEAQNIDLEFEDRSILKMICRVPDKWNG